MILIGGEREQGYCHHSIIQSYYSISFYDFQSLSFIKDKTILNIKISLYNFAIPIFVIIIYYKKRMRLIKQYDALTQNFNQTI